jgi:hypothetical protein
MHDVMHRPPSTADARAFTLASEWSAQTYARIAGMLFLITMLCGFFGEMFVPSKLVVGADAAATARNVVANDALFRLSVVSYLIEALCDVALSLVLYLLLRPVRRDLALLAAFFGLVSTALYGVAEVFYFAPTLLLGGAEYLKAFTPEQVNALALLCFKLYARVGGMFMVFYGIAAVVRGYLIFRSGYLPKALGVLLAIAGLGFITRNFVLVLAPAHATDLLLAPMAVAVLSMTVWLLVRGVDVARWNARCFASVDPEPA